MASFIDGIRTFFKERKGSRLILILLTALLLELVAALQYTYTRNLLIKEEERITRMELTMESADYADGTDDGVRGRPPYPGGGGAVDVRE